jgi:hypothetical protein
MDSESPGAGYPVGFTPDGGALAWWSADGSAASGLRVLDVAGRKGRSAVSLPGLTAIVLSADGGSRSSPGQTRTPLQALST